MPSQTINWILFDIMFYTVMFILVPPKKGPEVSPFGFWMGLVQAIVVLGLGQTLFKLFQLVGDPVFLGIPILTALSWVPPAILFAYFYPFKASQTGKVLYILLFAAGTTIVQYILQLLGMWANLHWNPFYTFLLAIATHSIMTVYLHVKYKIPI